ncbi:MAG: hypothetical protein SCH98_18995 [Deferrisomatales bacterium]|nr:hypothetical protein [Deferrisomatales bacterium]
MKIRIGAALLCLLSAGAAVAAGLVQERFRYEAALVRFLPGEATWVLRTDPATATASASTAPLPRLSVRVSAPTDPADSRAENADAPGTVPKGPHPSALSREGSCPGGVLP